MMGDHVREVFIGSLDERRLIPKKRAALPQQLVHRWAHDHRRLMPLKPGQR